MLTFHPLARGNKFPSADYIFEDIESFSSMLPYMLPKIEGDWNIVLIDPPLDRVRIYVSTEVIPEYLNLAIYLDKEKLGQILMENPKLHAEKTSPWDKYLKLLADFPVQFDPKAAKELFYRVGPETDKLERALELLKDCSYVTIKELNKRFVATRRVYARQVAIAFLSHERPDKCWSLYNQLEHDLGMEISYYAIRKYIRKLMKEKDAYLSNKDTKDNAVTKIDVYSVIHAFYLFNQSTSYKQLPALLSCIERRTLPC